MVTMCDYTMDPDGDTILTLKNPNAPFCQLPGDDVKHKSIKLEVDDSTIGGGSFLLDDDHTSSHVHGHRSQPPRKKARIAGPSSINLASTVPHQAQEPSRPVTFRLSSRHLILASPIFKAALKGGWKEGSAVGGEFRIDAEDWNVAALAIVMDVIHGRHRRVPKEIDRNMFTMVAAIVDYYDVHEIIQPQSTAWINHLRPTTGNMGFASGQTVFCWMSISLVFGDEPIFANAVRAALLESSGPAVCPETLPIAFVIGKPLHISFPDGIPA